MKVTTDACVFGAWVSQLLTKDNTFKNILDIGAGTGLLSLMVAQKNPFAKITAIEIDEQSAQQARENIADSPWTDRITIINSDLRTWPTNDRFDIIISNPPFYDNDLKSDDEKKNIAHHGSELSLPDLMNFMGKQISRDGAFFLLLPSKRWKTALSQLKKNKLEPSTIVHLKQTENHNEFRILVQGKRSSESPNPKFNEEEFVIKREDNYTTEFINLLKDYYLYLDK